MDLLQHNYRNVQWAEDDKEELTPALCFVTSRGWDTPAGKIQGDLYLGHQVNYLPVLWTAKTPPQKGCWAELPS